ncbi:MAG TPA: hypothetical protein VFV99_04065 [Kofleriaceae bacterium]|nr:hypothetical protein [Kofleriaceae bacterium]
MLTVATPAHAYEFWFRARTYGQAYQLRDYRLVGPDLFLGRRRVTQMLILRIYDIGDLEATRRLSRLPPGGPRITWQSYLRIDHDFGDFSSGRVLLPGPIRRDALDVIPELGESVAGLDLMYGYLEVSGLANDRLTLQLGRILTEDGWGTSAFDGGATRVDIPGTPVTLTATGGLHVRASSPLGVAAYELDGTSGAGCTEYVEGPTPGTGSWQLIDRQRTITNRKLASDYEYCPQRDVRQPTIGATLAMTRVHGVSAEVGYRRTWSETVGIIGSVDRFDFPDRGLYPNEFGQAPESGVDENRVYARAHVDVQAGPYAVTPFASARYSILHGLFDRGDLGLRMQRGAHAIEPAIEYYFPTFDGDSIFNAFSIEPTTDMRLAYQYAPRTAWQASASAWLRKYQNADELSPYAGGVDARLEHMFGGAWRGRVDALYDDGWGGRRVGGAVEGAWKRSQSLFLRGRFVMLDVKEDETSASALGPRNFVTTSAVTSLTYRIGDQAAIHAIAETDYDATNELQFRMFGVLDLNFSPEP